MNTTKVNGAVEVIGGQLDCIKEVLDSCEFEELSGLNKIIVDNCLQLIVLAANEVRKN